MAQFTWQEVAQHNDTTTELSWTPASEATKHCPGYINGLWELVTLPVWFPNLTIITRH